MNSDEMKEMFEIITIESMPVYSLTECIDACELHMKEVVEKDEEDNTEDDTEDDVNSIEEIEEQFRSALYLCNEREKAFLALVAEMTDKKVAWTEEVNYYPFRVFAENDFIYLFLWDNQYHLVLPEELMIIYKEVISEDDFSTINKQKLEMSEYAAALINLYGAYDIEWFTDVWNHHHKDKITEEEAENFLSDRESFNSDFYFYDWFVIHDSMMVDEFDELWELTEELDYYMPTKSVIRQYAGKGYGDFKIPGEHEMDDFLAEYIQDEQTLEMLQFEITESCERLKSEEEVEEILSDADAPLGDEIFCECFDKLYNTLRDNTHIWELKGFTPYQYQEETDDVIPHFKLPRGNI